MKKYDIFISYRRTSYDTANLIATRLKSAGYSVFFDVEALRSGKFNEQLYEVIDNCDDFIIVLPPNALDRCVNEDDWVRLEVCRAMEKGKNIVPIMLNGFVWPNPMPQGMEELYQYQALTATSFEYFDMAMEKMQKQYLKSKPHLAILKITKIVSASILSLIAVIAILFGVFRVLSKDVCSHYATSIAMDASYVYNIVDENRGLAKDWSEFNNSLNYETRPDKLAELQKNMLARVDLVEKNIKQTWFVDSTKLDINPYHRFLLSLHGINAEEISIYPQLVTLYYKDYLEQLRVVRNTVETPNSINRRFSTALFEVFEHSANSFYVAILADLSLFPKSARTTYDEMVTHWIYFPTQYKIDESKEYYENIINTEDKKIEEIMGRFESMLEYQDATYDDLESKNDALEQQMTEGFSYLQAVIDSAVAMQEIEKIKKDNEQELAMRREKLATKEVMVNTMKDELEDIDKQYIQTYEKLKKKCAIEEEDDQWDKWGKIRRWGAFLSMIVESRQSLLSQGIYNTLSITPEVAYADMNSQLTVYQTYHPESKDYVAPTKQFFKELSKGERQYAGVIVFGFKDDAKHPFFKQGDIVVQYDGKQIKNYSEFKEAYRNNELGEVVFLRLIDGNFETIKKQISETDIVGFLELTE